MKRGRKPTDLTGQKFNRLTVLEYAGSEKYPCGTVVRMWKCKCDCGNLTRVSGAHLKSGKVRSCGCLNSERIRLPRVSKSHKRILSIWSGMKDRCCNPNYHSYPRYGGRGIFICDEWLNDSKAFEMWAIANGYSDDLSIDRIDNDKGYSPENCRWVSKTIQQNNTSKNRYLEFEGKRMSIAEWARYLGINRATIDWRLRKGLPIEKVLEV